MGEGVEWERGGKGEASPLTFELSAQNYKLITSHLCCALCTLECYNLPKNLREYTENGINDDICEKGV